MIDLKIFVFEDVDNVDMHVYERERSGQEQDAKKTAVVPKFTNCALRDKL